VQKKELRSKGNIELLNEMQNLGIKVRVIFAEQIDYEQNFSEIEIALYDEIYCDEYYLHDGKIVKCVTYFKEHPQILALSEQFKKYWDIAKDWPIDNGGDLN
jgi:hypothetical protein